MWLKDLHLLNRRKLDSRTSQSVAADLSGGPLTSGAFELRTCQREMLVFWEPAFAAACGSVPNDREGWEHRHGASAYEYLLRVVAGLESALVGETEILGQFKQALAARGSNARFPRELDTVFQKVLEDAKEARTLFLQSLGQSSYGSLARRILLEHGLEQGARVLVLGAGQLSRAVVPFLSSNWSVGIWNRTPQRTERMVVDLRAKARQSTRVRDFSLAALTDAEQTARFAAEADAIVVCVPPAAADEFLLTVPSMPFPRYAIHLGGRRAELQPQWLSADVNTWALDDVFALFKDSMEDRDAKIAGALRFARERALLRTLGPSATSVAHGWEDLALFV